MENGVSCLPGYKEFNSILAPFSPQFAGIMNRAVFLDRDGYIIAEKTICTAPRRWRFSAARAPRAETAGGRGFQTHHRHQRQSGIGRGFFTPWPTPGDRN